jgi:hypothetical protein
MVAKDLPTAQNTREAIMIVIPQALPYGRSAHVGTFLTAWDGLMRQPELRSCTKQK